MSIFDDIRKDLEAGTPGDWTYGGGRTLHAEARESPNGNRDGALAVVVAGEENAWIYEHDCYRIARVPQLEAIALAAEELVKVAEQYGWHCNDIEFHDELHALIEACK